MTGWAGETIMARMKIRLGWLVVLGLTLTGLAAGPDKPGAQRWLYVSANLLPEASVSNTLALLTRVAGEGYTGMVLTDYKFMRWDDVPGAYVQHCRAIRDATRRLHLTLVAAVMPMGYSNSLLSRDPNLAEGLPVRDAPFVARAGRLEPVDETAHLVNGGFETFRGHAPEGWAFVDAPGKMAFADTATTCEGRASLRMQDVGRHEPEHRHARVCQRLTLRPFSAYHVSVALKTQDWDADDTRITILGDNGRSLNFHTPPIERTRDWMRLDIVFNTLEATGVSLYLGTWDGRSGTIWWDDARIEPAGFMNVLRRDGTPLRITSEDRTVVYEEGRDFTPVRDPKLGADPWAGEYNAWHAAPVVSLPSGSRIQDGQRVLASYYHAAIVNEEQVTCCMSADKVYAILEWQAGQVRDALQPDGYMMMHDEIRAQGWDESCSRRNLSPAAILADNVKRCVALLQRADPGKPLYVWSDMFDPKHNARKAGQYYLVKGDGPWYGSWEGLPPEVTVMNWQMDARTRRDTLKHFSGRGHHQILAGYYDSDPRQIAGWLRDAAGLPGIDGVMYTTWRHNYQDTAAFIKAAGN